MNQKDPVQATEREFPMFSFFAGTVKAVLHYVLRKIIGDENLQH
jgi:hypothetical protein